MRFYCSNCIRMYSIYQSIKGGQAVMGGRNGATNIGAARPRPSSSVQEPAMVGFKWSIELRTDAAFHPPICTPNDLPIEATKESTLLHNEHQHAQ